MKNSKLILLAAAAIAAAAPALAAHAQGLRREPARITLTALGSYDSGLRDESAAEIVAHDPREQRLFVINAAQSSIDVLDIANPAQPALVRTLSEEGGDANSVAVHDGLVAVAFAADPKTDPGQVVFYDARTLERLAAVTVGALPDMLTFTPNGNAVLVANEGETDGYGEGLADPEGSVSVIDLRLTRNCLVGLPRPRPVGGMLRCLLGRDLNMDARVRTIDFRAFNDQKAALLAQGVRIYGPGATVAQDLEPEYISVAADGRSAWVVLQEANAAAVLDLSNLSAPSVTRIVPFGRKNHALPGNELDASDRDNAINIRNWPVLGLYQPDAIASYRVRGQNYYVTANEGDDRNDFIAGEETRRVSALATSPGLDPAVFGDITALRNNAALGRLTVTAATSARNALGQLTELEVIGARSFSIFNEAGSLVFDSGADFERITAARYPLNFNASNDNNNFDDRSDNKGPEPEGVVLGTVRGRTFAFIGLERIGGVMIYDITDPASATFVDYVNNRDFTLSPTGAAPTDNGPEGLAFIEAKDSPTRQPLLVIGNEVSGTTTIYSVDLVD
ncbi:choice-of-anchor I family protein [Nevskia sp.]|uniref:choice-of-anchor I family protein n=1 Tax=Nevskia sp. TaxID=1929292 RepID=UPI0025EB3CB8|nr:choice-of-anchor I family protein [Nevskia sp.]